MQTHGVHAADAPRLAHRAARMPLQLGKHFQFETLGHLQVSLWIMVEVRGALSLTKHGALCRARHPHGRALRHVPRTWQELLGTENFTVWEAFGQLTKHSLVCKEHFH